MYYQYQFRSEHVSLFLGGNYGQCVITTGTENGKHLLLVKDSFANSFVPFLTGDYETITMLDLRYFRGSVQELAAEADDILVLTEITNLAASGEYSSSGEITRPLNRRHPSVLYFESTQSSNIMPVMYEYVFSS